MINDPLLGIFLFSDPVAGRLFMKDDQVPNHADYTANGEKHEQDMKKRVSGGFHDF